jgi:hypothetical protein
LEYAGNASGDGQDGGLVHKNNESARSDDWVNTIE